MKRCVIVSNPELFGRLNVEAHLVSHISLAGLLIAQLMSALTSRKPAALRFLVRDFDSVEQNEDGAYRS